MVSSSVVFGTQVGVSVVSVIWFEFLMTSAISCHLWSSVYECQREDLVWYVCDVLYVPVNCFVAVDVLSRGGIYMFSIVVCLVLLICTLINKNRMNQFCVVCINGRRYVCCSECYVVLTSVMSPLPVLCDISVRTVVDCTVGDFALGVSLFSE